MKFKNHAVITSLMLLVAVSYVQAATDMTVDSSNAVALKGFTFTDQQKPQASMIQSGTLPKNELRILTKSVSGQGLQHLRYQQYFHGVKVEGRQVIAHRADVNRNSEYSGRIAVSLEQDLPKFITAPGFSLDVARQMILLHNYAVGENKLLRSSALPIIYVDDRQQAHYAYKLEYFFLGAHPSKPIYIVDAKSKKILTSYDNLQTEGQSILAQGPGGNIKTGRYIYGKTPSFPAMAIQNTGSSCQMNNSNVKTLDYSQLDFDAMNLDFDKLPAHEFRCNKRNHYNHIDRMINGAYAVEDDAESFGMVIFNMYKDWYHLSPLNKKLNMVIHIPNFDNAFWDGTAMFFGDGETFFYPLTSLDVTAHEVSHGFTEFQSGLEYHDQSGSLNEAFSDMAGVAAVNYAYGKNSWGLGADITKPGQGVICDEKGTEALRCMNDPVQNLSGFGIENANDYPGMVDRIRLKVAQVVDTTHAVEDKARQLAANEVDELIAAGKIDRKDREKAIEEHTNALLRDHYHEIREHLIYSRSQGPIVHSASGVFNKAFYLLATSPGWDVHSAFDVMVYANQHFWTPTSDFIDAARGVVSSAEDLGRNVGDVRAVFQQVGIDLVS